MNQHEIDAQIDALREALVANDEAKGSEAALRLLAGFLKNISRIADAVEEIAA